MSFTDFKEITVNNPGTSLRYGGNDLKQIMEILNAKVVSGKRPKILNEWIWMDHFDIAPPAIAPGNPTDTNASRFYADPNTFKIKVKKTSGTILDIENIDIPDTALAQITNKAKLPSTIAYEDEANTFTLSQIFNRGAQASIAETIATFKVSDGLSKIEILNASSTDAVFSPWIRSYNLDSTTPALYFYGYIGDALDTGGEAGMRFDVRKEDNTALTTRPFYSFRSGGTEVFAIGQTTVAFGSRTLVNAVLGSTITGIVDANISAHTTTKITTTDKTLLNTSIAYEDEANTFTGKQTVNKAAEAGVAEVLQEWKVSDAGNSRIDIVNVSGTDANFAPQIRSFFEQASTAQPGLYFFSHIPSTQDGGTVPALIFDSRRNNNAAITVRPLFSFRTAAVSVFEITPTLFDFTNKFLTNIKEARIRNPANTFSTTIVNSAITADRTLTLPLLTANDIAVTEAFTQTLSNKTIGPYIDFDDTTPPANPAAGFRRLFADSSNSSKLSVKKSDGTVVDIETGSTVSTLDSLSDVVITTVAVNQVPTWDGTNWVNATPPGASGGEANTASNIGTAGTGFHKQKTGVDLEFYKLNALSNKLSLALDAGNNKVDIDVTEANLTLNSIGGSISTRSKLPTPVVYDDEANTYGDFDQIFRSSRLLITNPANTFNYTIVGSAITAGRTVTLPLLTANDTFLMQAFAADVTARKRFTDSSLAVFNPALTFQYIVRSAALTADRDISLPLLAAADIFVFEAFAQPLTNKTINGSLNTITNIGDAAIAAAGITTRSKLPAELVYVDEANTYGDFDQLFLSSRLLIKSPTDTPTYIVAGSSITANRTITIPLLVANDTFVMALHPQTLEGKTISGGLNTITEITDAAIAASGITTRTKLPTAVAYEDEINVFTVAQTFNSYQEDAKIAAPANPGLEAARRYFKQVNTNNNAICVKQKINGAIREVRTF